MHHDWSCSVQPVVGRETPMDLESYQVTEASSDALREIYDGLSAYNDSFEYDNAIYTKKQGG